MLRKLLIKMTCLGLILFISAAVMAQEEVVDQKIIGDWKGALSVQGQEMPLVFHFMLNDKKVLISTLDSPLQNGFDIPMGKVTLVEKKYKIDATNLGATYEGTLKNDSILVGKWLQGGMSFDLVMKREKIKVLGDGSFH